MNRITAHIETLLDRNGWLSPKPRSVTRKPLPPGEPITYHHGYDCCCASCLDCATPAYMVPPESEGGNG